MRAFSSSMPRVGASVIVLFACVAACAGGSPSPPTSTPSSNAWTELRVSWDFGPCPADGRSCHQSIAVSPNGGFVASETPNSSDADAGTDAARRFAALDAHEVRELHRIVDAADFAPKVGTFGCPPEYDATIRIELEGPWGVRHDDIGGCVHAATPNAPRALVELLERHRFVTRDAPPTHVTKPSSVGERCTVSVGCGNDLTCIAFPCVVAPCESGACQVKSKP